MAKLIAFVSFVTIWVFSVHADHTDTVRAHPGDNITLDCSTGDMSLTDNSGVYWTRSDQKWPDYLMFYCGHLDNSKQDPRYQNRIELAHPHLKDKNFSIIILNLSANDSETYQCTLIQGHDHKTIRIIKLIVTEPDKVVIHAHTCQNVTLNCSSGDTKITDSIGIYWTRTDLEQPKYVLFYRDGDSDHDHQDSRYKDRVELVCPDLSSSNMSLILRNLSTDDSGTYECKLIQKGNMFDVPPIRSFELNVTEPEMDHGLDKKNLWLIPIIPSGVFLAVAVTLGFLLYQALFNVENWFMPW